MAHDSSKNWQCSCGRLNAAYVSSCYCGKSKRGVVLSIKEDVVKVSKFDDTVKECVKQDTCELCGEQLDDADRICGNCGAVIPSRRSGDLRRGLIRIAAGTIMVILQVLSILGLIISGNSFGGGVAYNIGFYSCGIIGVVLIIYGSRAYKNWIYSEMVLHTGGGLPCQVIKWSMLGVSFFALLVHVLLIDSLSLFVILASVAMLCLAIYLLFYMGKRASCLFSATLVFWGVANVLTSLEALLYYFAYLSQWYDADWYLALGIIPKIVAGILYIVIATMLYKEDFSTVAVKVLGWGFLILELITRVLCDAVIGGKIYIFSNVRNFISLLWVIGLFLFVSILPVNSFREIPIKKIVKPICFCRKCGSKLHGDSEFCHVCGVKVIREELL